MSRPLAGRLGRRLRQLRRDRCWSQEELASRAALRVAELLETTLDELVHDGDPNPCRRAILARLPACSALPPHLAPLLLGMMDFVLTLHRGFEELTSSGALVERSKEKG
jgi:hypothetical protein